MTRRASLRPLGQLSAYGAAMGGLVGGLVAAATTVPLLGTGALGFLIATLPAFFFGQTVGVLTGLIAPNVAAAALAVVRPRTLVGWRATITITVALACALPAGLLVAMVGLPLSLFYHYPHAGLIIVVASMLVTAIIAWRLAPTMGRSPHEPMPSASARLGWWLIALGLTPVISVLAVYLSAWMDLNFTFDEGQHAIPPVAASLVLLLALIVTADVVLLAPGIALAWRSRAWEHGDFVLYWAMAALGAALLAAIGFWRLVRESMY